MNREASSMGMFVIRSAHIRAGKFVADRTAEAEELSWQQLVERFAPHKSRKAVMLLRALRPRMFVGVRQVGETLATFAFDVAGRSNDASRVLNRIPAFEETVTNLGFIEEVRWHLSLTELGRS